MGSATSHDGRKKLGRTAKATIRQRRLMRNLLTGQNFTEAAIQAGYSPVTVAKKGRSVLRPEQWAHVLHLAGLDDHTLGKCLHDLVHAKSVKFFSDKGRVMDQREVIDWDARARGLDMALRIREAYGEKQQTPLRFGVETDGGPVRVVVKWPESCPRAQPGCAGTPGIRPPALQRSATGDTEKRRNASRQKALRSAPPQDEQGRPVPERP